MEVKATIRFVRQNDFSRWLPLWEGYNQFYGRSAKTALPQEITETTWSRFLDPLEPIFALVAESEGELLGLVHYLFHRSTTLLNHTCYLQDLFTRADLRGRGIGRSLINSVYEQAKVHGSSRVYWQTHETNHDAMKLYNRVAERSGFLVYRHII